MRSRPFPELPPQRARVAMLIAADRTPTQIAAELGLTSRTVHEYGYDIRCKLGVNGAAGVAAIAFRRGYLQ